MAIRPRNAASLIVIDRSGNEPRFLLGRRNDALKFMPGKYVFPGGKTDPCDRRVSPVGSIAAFSMDRLQASLGLSGRPHSAHALALSAIRETCEEAGVFVGQPFPFETKQSQWQPFAGRGLSPDLSQLRYVARAITPPEFSRRYDTRFFATFRDVVIETEIQQHQDSEMLDFCYVTQEQTTVMNLPGITRIILKSIADRLAIDPELNLDKPVPNFLSRRGKFICEFA